MNSMTGFGLGRAEGDCGVVTVEARSVNSRFLDLALRVPSELNSFEPLIRAELQKRCARGKVFLSVRFDARPGAGEQYALNQPLLEMLEHYCQARGHAPQLDRLLAIDGVVLRQVDEAIQEDLRRLLLRALEGCLAGLQAERQTEGDKLRRALLGIRERLVEALATVEANRSGIVERLRVRLRERITELLAPMNVALDPGRLEQEVAFAADRADVTEECTRLGAHLGRLEELLTKPGEAQLGRQLEFLTQEILREVNTIGSKSKDLEITRQVLEMKNHAENLREQLANLE